MPLPDRSTTWPPAEMTNVLDAVREWDAWYTGNVDQLEMIYSTVRQQTHASMWGQIRRRFFGTPNPTNVSQNPVKLHVPYPAEIARMSASMLLEEMPKVWYPREDDTQDADDPTPEAETPTGAQEDTAESRANDRLDDLLDDDAHSALLEGLEYAAAHGGAYVRVSWDTSASSPEKTKPFLTVMATDSAVPEFRWGRLVAVTFWSELPGVEGRDGVYRLLERHEPGSIEWGLYESQDRGELGHRVPLAEHPFTLYLADVVDENAQVKTGSDLLTAIYVPNKKANKRLRRDPVAKNHGSSDFDGAEDLFDFADEIETSYQRDIRLAKTRIMVPKGMLTSMGAGNGATFNADQEVFTELGTQVGSLNPGTGRATPQGSAQSFIHTFQPTIRAADHESAMNHIRNEIYQACGYSPQSFGESGDMAITATETVAREKQSILTRSAKIIALRPRLAHLAAVLLDVDAYVFNGPGRPADDILPDVEFPDAAAVNPKVQAETVNLLNTSESASIEERVKFLHPDWEQRQVDVEVQKIRDDLAMLPDPSMAHLWMAEAANGSATGGVHATRDGVEPGNAAAVNQANAALVKQEAAADGGPAAK